MHYVCLENKIIVSILNYQPAVPNTVSVIEITDDQYRLLEAQTHYFDIATNSILPVANSELEKKQQETDNIQPRNYLDSTDWMVLRHLRQKTLGIPTSLTEQEFLELEQKRNDAAAKIK
jgi:hypothetical protein